MTECERLISEGKLSEDFLKEETRNDYTISSEMKKVWAISIDLSQELISVCQKHNLKLFAICGTNIGVVRHKGFIPWDDDIDFGLPREDYDKLLSIAKTEFKHPYFMQTSLSDPYFYNRPFARLRNSLTTGISPCDEKLKCNNGIFIDIFPLDYYSDDFKHNFFIKKAKIKSLVAWNKIHYKYAENNRLIRTLLKIFSPVILMGGVAKFFKKHNAYCSTIKESDQIGMQYSFFGTNFKTFIWPKNCFNNTIYLPFEYIQLPIPEEYDEVLKITYGDYMSFPPKETWGTHHSLKFDADTPYKEYCSKNYGVKYPD